MLFFLALRLPERPRSVVSDAVHRRNHKDPIPFERALGIAMRVLAGKVIMGGDGEGQGVRIMLNDGPDRHCWAIERAFGVKMEVE